MKACRFISSVLVLTSGIFCGHLPVYAEDIIICDPENPSCQPVDEPDTSEDDGGVEEIVICDPENPSCVSAEKDVENQSNTSGGYVLSPVDAPSGVASEAMPVELLFKVEWGSSLAVDTYWSQEGEDHFELGSGVDVSFSQDVNDSSKAVIRAQMRHWIGARKQAFGAQREDADTRAEIDIRLGESYWRRRWDSVSLRVGMLQSAWGSTSLVQPGNVINPRDQRNFGMVGPMQQDGKLAQPAVELTWSSPGKGGVELLWVPFFMADRTVLFGRDVGVLQDNNPIAANFPVVPLMKSLLDPGAWDQAQGLSSLFAFPDEDFTSSSLGARWTRTVLNTDIGVGYFWGWDRTQSLYVDEEFSELVRVVLSDEQFAQDYNFTSLAVRNPRVLELSNSIAQKQRDGEDVFAAEYQRRHTMLMDVTRYVGPIGVRADVALSPAQNFLTTDLNTVRRPSAFGAMGLSYERLFESGATLGLLAEGFVLHPFGAEDDATVFFVSEDERGDEDAQIVFIGDLLYGVAMGGTLELPELGLSSRVGGVYNVSTRDVIVQGSVRKALGDRGVGISLGGALYEGPPLSESLTPGGLYDGNDQLWLGCDGMF